jgi:hypothetical protein
VVGGRLALAHAPWRLTLTLLAGEFAICRLAAGAPLPDWAMSGPFVSMTRTCDELSVVCPSQLPPDGTRMQAGWRCLRVEGPFALESTLGVLAALAVPLAEAGISIFAVSTYDTDYLLIQQAQIAEAAAALQEHGHTVRTDSAGPGVS